MKILYAEDEKMIQELYSMEMEAELDGVVVNVADGEEAINALKKSSNYDLIISDYNMPKKNGGELYAFVQENCPSIPFILTSGDSIDQYNEFSSFREDNRGNRSFVKPFNVDDMIAHIKKLFADKQEANASDYYRVRISLFSLFNSVSANTYIKISDDKYVKIIGSIKISVGNFGSILEKSS